ncbi:TetR-like C-terminal domain-containing protein [Streptomyces albus]|uniref:TetR-like C-terminal domain-containing protein n=1 Tax=Streptomyces albus TaxID=1888 RepID=UPI0024ADE197|nr:TetR-like C-terminal domain-containing protein [Streptomyces albus]MDI6413575.1 TetR-like C-terminal domain-containing protein [Streptomyces albus]
MTEPRPHGSTRPGGRTARTRAAVLAAALEALDTQDFASLTVDLLARRSGVHAATIRRRWRSVEGVISDLLTQHGTAAIPIPDTGDLRQDLHAMARAIADFHTAPRNRRLLEGMVAAASRQQGAEEVLREIFARRLRQVAVLLHRAAERGEVPADTDAEGVIAALGAPFYYRLLITRGPLDDELVSSSAETAYLAAVHGVFRTGSTGSTASTDSTDSTGSPNSPDSPAGTGPTTGTGPAAGTVRNGGRGHRAGDEAARPHRGRG